jgi:hypothetical protein
VAILVVVQASRLPLCGRDGLAAVGGPQCITAIETAYTRHFDSEVDRVKFQEFLEEALEQLRTGVFGESQP